MKSPEWDPEWESTGFTQKVVNLFVDWVNAQKIPDLKLQVYNFFKRFTLLGTFFRKTYSAHIH